MWHEYPTEAIRGAVAVALSYGLTDVARIETMVLRRIAGDFFRLPTESAMRPRGAAGLEPTDDKPQRLRQRCFELLRGGRQIARMVLRHDLPSRESEDLV